VLTGVQALDACDVGGATNVIESDGYGDAFGRRLRAPITGYVRSLRNAGIAVTEIRSPENPQYGISGTLMREDAFLVALQLADYPVHQYFEDDRAAPVTALRAGDTTLYDLKRSPQFIINGFGHSVHFYLPRAALNMIADSSEARHITELRYQPGAGVDDPVMRALVSSVLPALEFPEQASRLFVEHVIMAVGIHAAKTYGGMQSLARPLRGGLAPWQMKRAAETLSENLAGDVSLSKLANDCGLSPSHFGRAFRQSTGISPHQWLLKQRVEQAKNLLRDRSLSLADVALSCGFADQSHLTRIFSRMTGASPGAWRRSISD
jgi:AraC-like DNA-binding protein